MRKKIIAIGLAITMIFAIVGLIGCGEQVIEIETDYFVVELNSGSMTATILELTELGQQQEILVIPSYIQGYRVTQIGWVRWNRGRIVENRGMRSENLRKLYISYTVERIPIYHNIIHDKFEVVFLMAFLPTGWSRLTSYWMTENPIAISGFFNLSVTFYRPQGGVIRRHQIPNIIYYYNFAYAPNSGIFWLDHIIEGSLYIRPSTPMRSGYLFKGWFLDEEATIRWNCLHPTTYEEEIKLFASWQAI